MLLTSERNGKRSGGGLFLSCRLCGRKQLDGLLSRGWWSSLQAGRTTLHACPTCRTVHEDWAARLKASPEAREHLRLIPGGARGASAEPPARGHLEVVRA